MKKKIVASIGAMAAAGVIGLVFWQSGVVNADPELSRADIEKQVKEQYPGEITELELEKENNRTVYEVEVLSDGKEYDLTIHGDTGKVIKLEEKAATSEDTVDSKRDDQDDDADDETDDDNPADQSKKDDKDTNNGSSTNNDTVIGMEEAEKIALENFDGKVVEKEQEDDDGQHVYKFEIVNGNKEAEIEIDVYTGEVLVLEIETEEER